MYLFKFISKNVKQTKRTLLREGGTGVIPIYIFPTTEIHLGETWYECWHLKNYICKFCTKSYYQNFNKTYINVEALHTGATTMARDLKVPGA